MSQSPLSWRCIVLLLGCVALATAPARARGEDATLFREAAVFDGRLSLGTADVLVKQGRIAQVGQQIAAPSGARVIEARGKTLLPGLIDSHTHLAEPGMLRQAIVFGVTTELDMFTDTGMVAELRSAQAGGKAIDRADVLSSGTLVTVPGGHGTEYGLKIPTISGPGEAQAFVDARLAEGSDYIKLIYDDGQEVNLPMPTLSRETLSAVIKATHARKKLAVVHVMARAKAVDALTAGADGLAHIFIDMPPDDAFVRLAAEKKAFVISTLTVIETVHGIGGGAKVAEDRALAAFLTPANVRALKASFPRPPVTEEQRSIPARAVRMLKAAGVPILAGTDAMNPGTVHGASLHRELELLVAAGLTAPEALAAATSVPAAAFGLSDRGQIAPGRRADLVLLDGDPTTDIKATRRIAGVWKQGHEVDREAYRKEIQKDADRLAQASKMPAPPGSEKGLVSDFDGEAIRSAFGSGWAVSTDGLFGGKSKAELALAPDGAEGSKGSLLIRGTVTGESPARWAGAMFSPGPVMMAPANLSAKKALSFWAKGDGKNFQVMLFFQANGFTPSIKNFTAGKEWKKHRFDLKEFNDCDGSGLLGVFIGSGAEAGPFTLQVDNVRFE